MLKSAIFFDNNSPVTEMRGIDSTLSPDDIKYGITMEKRQDFGSEAYQFSQESKSKEYVVLTLACDSLTQMWK